MANLIWFDSIIRPFGPMAVRLLTGFPLGRDLFCFAQEMSFIFWKMHHVSHIIPRSKLTTEFELLQSTCIWQCLRRWHYHSSGKQQIGEGSSSTLISNANTLRYKWTATSLLLQFTCIWQSLRRGISIQVARSRLGKAQVQHWFQTQTLWDTSELQYHCCCSSPVSDSACGGGITIQVASSILGKVQDQNTQRIIKCKLLGSISLKVEFQV